MMLKICSDNKQVSLTIMRKLKLSTATNPKTKGAAHIIW